METLHIIDSGPGWLVVDKPCDLSVHNEPGKDLISFLQRQIESDPDLSKRLAYGKGSFIGPVHRLDRETSGVILLALTQETSRWFSQQFEHRHVIKKYMAVVHGSFSETGPLELVWDTPLSPEAGGRQDPQGKGGKVPCATGVRVIRQSPHYSLIECDLLTGRKHQIRRHAKLAGHPVLGDTRYGSKRAVDYVRTQCLFTRMGLHSLSLEVGMPGGFEKRIFRSEIPVEFLGVMDLDGHGLTRTNTD
ncbi:MAG: RNA pseudouridine synthase [Proteobacteria bacterium]|nr:RNA pseudouridine synthase [Pseudomonadota bacterium]